MVIIFYESDKEQVYICTEREKMKIVPVNEPDLLSYIPNDDILYVQTGQYITKNQFMEWLKGSGEDDTKESHHFTDLSDEPVPDSLHELSTATINPNSKWIHPAHHGAILIADVQTPKYPEGIELVGKYDFVSIDELGGYEALEESAHFKYLLGKGKIEVVDYDYVKKHYGKKKQVSLADAALDRMIIKNDRRGSAEAVAAAGGLGLDSGSGSGSGAVEIFVET